MARVRLLETSHGRLRPRAPVASDVAAGVPAGAGAADALEAEAVAAVKRGKGGRLADSASAKRLGSRGGRARAEKLRAVAGMPVLLRRLGLRHAPEALLPYLADAEQFAAAERDRLAKLVGGGECGAAPSSFIQSAALQLAGSRAAFAAGDLMAGSRLADASRANLLSAHELAIREAEARKRATPSRYAPANGARPLPWAPQPPAPTDAKAAQPEAATTAAGESVSGGGS